MSLCTRDLSCGLCRDASEKSTLLCASVRLLRGYRASQALHVGDEMDWSVLPRKPLILESPLSAREVCFRVENPLICGRETYKLVRSLSLRSVLPKILHHSGMYPGEIRGGEAGILAEVVTYLPDVRNRSHSAAASWWSLHVASSASGAPAVIITPEQ